MATIYETADLHSHGERPDMTRRCVRRAEAAKRAALKVPSVGAAEDARARGLVHLSVIVRVAQQRNAQQRRHIWVVKVHQAVPQSINLTARHAHVRSSRQGAGGVGEGLFLVWSAPIQKRGMPCRDTPCIYSTNFEAFCRLTS